MTVKSTSTPLSPSFNYPRVEGSGLGVVSGSQELLPVGVDDETEVAGEVGQDLGVSFDAEDSQPQQSLKTPLLPSRAVIDEHH